MKKFCEYQYLGGEMSERDKKETKSKFWNKGKWDNFVAPLLPDGCKDLTLIDMGCNMGLFCKLAEDKGFRNVIGIDKDSEAIRKGNKYASKIKAKYKLIKGEMQEVELPLTDYTIFVNSHYYLNIGEFIPLLDKLRNRTRYCLVVSGNKNTYPHIASSDKKSLRNYFKDWEEVKGIDEIDGSDDLSPRRLWTLNFKSPTLKRVNMDLLDCGNHVQEDFYADIDKGVDYKRTRYFRIIKPYRLRKNARSRSVWTEGQLHEFFKNKIKLYMDMKENGLKQPIIVNNANRILDGNHRFIILKHLGYKTVLVRYV